MVVTMKCEHGIEDCIHLGKEHDEDSCFNGKWTHYYICNECGFGKLSTAFSTSKNTDGTYKAPEFKAQNCPRCKTEKSMT